MKCYYTIRQKDVGCMYTHVILKEYMCAGGFLMKLMPGRLDYVSFA